MVAALLLSLLAAAPAAARAPQAAGKIVPGQFIVELREGVNPRTTAREYAAGGARVRHVYSAAARGFSARMSDAAVRKARRDRRVARIEPDRVVRVATTQTDATWGLDRIDQRDLPLDGTYTQPRTGAGVIAYVLDTGIRATHRDFQGRVTTGFTAINDGRGTSDCHGHGTHVAGTVGGAVHGVAKDVTLVPVRVLDCNGSGTWSGVIAGIDWVTRDKQSRQAPAVANMSLGGGASSTVDSAVERSIAAGVTYAVAAGNANRDACTVSPARVPAALTVGASDRSDVRASFSNFGVCLDVFAPGVSITSAYHSRDNATATMSGTSMAAPHVAGVAALMLQATPAATPAEVHTATVDLATDGKISSAGAGSPTRLLHVPPATSEAEPEPVETPSTDEPPTAVEPPTASFTTSCHGGDCRFDSTSTGDVDTSTWRLADGSSVSGDSAIERYASPGSYTVALTVSNSGGSSTAERTVSCTWVGKGRKKTLSCA